jgi:hypothetical protein
MSDAVVIPLKLTAQAALRKIREIAADSNNIVVLSHAAKRSRQRKISRILVERCVRKGTVSEGPFLNQHGHWQVNLYRHAAGEEITCTVAIEWATKVLVITVF